MPLLNYTTSVSVSRTMGEIHKLLVEAGARQIMTEYDADGRAVGVAFSAITDSGPRSFLLPVDIDRVLLVLKRQKVQSRFQTPEHAERVGWRIVKDWLEAQLAIIKTEMVSLDQVMLPYLRTEDGRTVYDLYLEHEIAALSQGGAQ